MADLEVILRNKKRSLALFAPDVGGGYDFARELPYKQMRRDIKMANEYNILQALPEKDDGTLSILGSQPNAAVNQVLVNKGLLGDKVGTTLGMLTNEDATSSTAKGAQPSLALLPAVSGIYGTSAAPAGHLGPEQGPALPAPKNPTNAFANTSSTDPFGLPRMATVGKESTTSQMPDQVNLGLVRVNDNVIRLNDDNARLRALEKPQWNRPWKLHKVIAGHQGWVRCVAVDKENEWFCTSGDDRLIKFWNMATGELKLSLTGHV